MKDIFVTMWLLFLIMASIFFITSAIHGLFYPYNPAETMLVDTNEFSSARAVGVVVDNGTGTISFPTYYNWEINGLSYEWVRHDGNFVYGVGEIRVRPNNLDGCWNIQGCK